MDLAGLNIAGVVEALREVLALGKKVNVAG